jgi:hypothetical protein
MLYSPADAAEMFAAMHALTRKQVMDAELTEKSHVTMTRL